VLSQKTSLANGIDISNQRCRQFRKEDLAAFDRIYVMDRNNYTDVKQMSKNVWDEKKVGLLLDELYPDEHREVPDPWYGTEKDYHLVFEMIDKACNKIIEKYKSI
jgi:protein-tyrosine phosphatase